MDGFDTVFPGEITLFFSLVSSGWQIKYEIDSMSVEMCVQQSQSQICSLVSDLSRVSRFWNLRGSVTSIFLLTQCRVADNIK